MDLVKTLTDKELVPSMAHARRLIQMGGVRVDGAIVDQNIDLLGDEKITLRKAKGCTDIHKTSHNRGKQDK